MIIIKNRQRKISFDTETYQKNAQKILDFLGYPDFDLYILLTTNKTIRLYNRDYRNKDKATDILSFPFHHIAPGTKITPQGQDDKNLGDMIISMEYVVQDAKKLGVSLEQRMYRLLVHGITHLLGYDHMTEAEYKQMYALETKLMKHIGHFTPDPE
jgi:probable rRNA maturation factor